MTSVKGLFAAGDFVIGASTVIEAVGLGREAALKMDTWLMGRERRKLVVKIEPVAEPRRERAWDFIPPQHMPTEPMQDPLRRSEPGGREGLRPGAGGRGGQALLPLPPQVRDRRRQLHLLPGLHRGGAAQLHQAGRAASTIQDDGSYGALEETNEWDNVGAIWIDNNECIRCGACYMVCPTKCISITKNEIFYQDV